MEQETHEILFAKKVSPDDCVFDSIVKTWNVGTHTFPKHFQLDDRPFSSLCHRISRSIRISAHVVFLIQVADQLLIGVASHKRTDETIQLRK